MRALNTGDFVFLLLALRWTIVLSAMAARGRRGDRRSDRAIAGEQEPAARWAAIVYIRLFQGTPLLLQLFLVFFGADLLGLPLGPYVSAALGFSVNAGAFFGEIWRGSIEAVPGGQIEAAQALGLHYWPRMVRVVLPQAVRTAIPPTVGFLVNLIKSTSLAAIIGFVELTRAGQMLNNATFKPFLIFGTVAAIYFVLCWPLTIASRRLEARLAMRNET